MTKDTTKGGKLGVKGAKNRKSEENILRRKAIKSAKEHADFESKTPHKRIPIRKGFLMVPIEKYKKNKEHYDNLNR